MTDMRVGDKNALLKGNNSNIPQQTPDALGGLYQEILLEHSKYPRHKGRLTGCQLCQEGKNPVCGDEVNVFVKVHPGDGVARISASFEGKGCSISQASASMMCEAIQDLSVIDAQRLIDRAEDIYSGALKPADAEDPEDDLEALSGVANFPVRIKCAALPWKSLELLLAGHFDTNGLPVKKISENSEKPAARKLRVVSTET